MLGTEITFERAATQTFFNCDVELGNSWAIFLTILLQTLQRGLKLSTMADKSFGSTVCVRLSSLLIVLLKCGNTHAYGAVLLTIENIVHFENKTHSSSPSQSVVQFKVVTKYLFACKTFACKS